MHRLVMDVPVRQLHIEGAERTLDILESFTLLNRLKWDRSGYVGICRVVLKNPDDDLEGFVGNMGITEVKSIYREPSGAQIVLVTGRAEGLLAEAFHFPNIYLLGPLEIRDEKMKIGLVGMPEQLTKFLTGMKRAKVRFKILSLMDEKFSPSSPLSKLTEKQRKILFSAYDLGYYDIPRRFDSEQLAKKLKLGKSTVAEHLRKAERSLITETLKGA